MSTEFEFKRVELHGSSLKLTREEWFEVEIALGAAANAGETVTQIHINRDDGGNVIAITAVKQSDWRPFAFKPHEPLT